LRSDGRGGGTAGLRGDAGTSGLRGGGDRQRHVPQALREQGGLLPGGFEACARLVSRRIETGLEGIKGTPLRTEAGLRALVEVLAEEPDLARMVVVEARAGGMASREAQLQWLDRLAGLFAGEGVDAEAAWLARMGLRAATAIITLEVAADRTEILPNLPGELVEAALAAYRTLEA
jgi:hypothetical protein